MFYPKKICQKKLLQSKILNDQSLGSKLKKQADIDKDQYSFCKEQINAINSNSEKDDTIGDEYKDFNWQNFCISKNLIVENLLWQILLIIN